MSAELISFSVGADWIGKLWSKLKTIRKKYKNELDQINSIMFHDPIVLAKYYVEPFCQEHNPADRHEEDFLVSKELIMKKIDEFIRANLFHQGNNQMFILSDAGMGKTAFLTMLKLMHLNSFWPKGKNCELIKLGPDTIEKIKQIKDKRNTILLLDSLDEDIAAFGKAKDRIVEILSNTKIFYRVLITCRTQFFPDVEEDPFGTPGIAVIGGYRCPTKYLSFFNDDQVEIYLNKRFKTSIFKNPTNKILKSKEIIKKMGSLRCRPMLLAHIEDLIDSPKIDKISSEFDIYNSLIRNWLNRESRNTNFSVSNLEQACQILATYMMLKKRRSITEESLDKLILVLQKAKPIKLIDIKGRSLINRNSQGEYRFSHYSIQEFLVAKELIRKSGVKFKLPVPITTSILQFIASTGKKILHPSYVDFKNVNFRQIDIKKINFYKADLSGMNLSGANLNCANLSGVNFTGANLDNAILTGAVLTEANFTSASMNNANFSLANLESSIFNKTSAVKAKMLTSNFKKAKIINSRFQEVDFSSSIFISCKIFDSNFDRTNLSNSNVSNSEVSNCSFIDCNLTDALLQCSRFDKIFFDNSKFKHVNFYRGSLKASRLRGIEIKNSDFRETTLSESNLKNAVIMETNFYKSKLENADLSYARIWGCDLRCANLTGANLRYTDLGSLANNELKIKNAIIEKMIIGIKNYSIYFQKIQCDGKPKIVKDDPIFEKYCIE